jgi:vancomycin permeability regulator SanA
MKKKIKWLRIRRAFSALVLVFLIAASALVVLNRVVVTGSRQYILTPYQAAALNDVDCILVLGAGVYANRYPSMMLEDRLLRAIELYNLGVSDRLLMSGDNSKVYYNEVQVMKDYAVGKGVPSSDVFRDHAGFSTYESMYRARDVFNVSRVVIVTQDYHLYRAVYNARALGLEVWGVSSNLRAYGSGQRYRDAREFVARAKDWLFTVLQPEPTFLGDVIDVRGNADLTN